LLKLGCQGFGRGEGGGRVNVDLLIIKAVLILKKGQDGEVVLNIFYYTRNIFCRSSSSSRPRYIHYRLNIFLLIYIRLLCITKFVFPKGIVVTLSKVAILTE